MVYIYKVHICGFSNDDILRIYNASVVDRKIKADRIKNESAKKLSIVSGALMMYALKAQTGLLDDEIRILRTENGKPYAENLDIYFSLTHSKDLAICAISDKNIGIDAEKVRPIKKDVAKKCFVLEEQQYVFEDETKATERFFEVWTKKEAYSKLIGNGIKDFLRFNSLDKNIKTIQEDGYIISIAGECEEIKFVEVKNGEL